MVQLFQGLKMNHKIKTHFWDNGRLITEERHYPSLEEARQFLRELGKEIHSFKIYSEFGELVDAGNVAPVTESYA